MHIGVVIKRLDVAGGSQRAALEFARFARGEGHRVTVYADLYSAGAGHSALLGDIPVACVRAPASGDPLVASGRRPIRYLKARAERFFRSWQLASIVSNDIELLIGFDNSVGEVLAWLKRRRQVRTAWVCVDLPPSFRVGIATVRLPAWTRSLEWPERALERFVARRHDVIIAHARKNADLARHLFGRPVVLIHPGVDLRAFTPSRKEAVSGRAFRVATVASFAPYRRFEDLVQAAAIVRRELPVELIVAGDQTGDSTYANAIRKLADDMGLLDVATFPGTLSESQLRSLYHWADVFVWPNHNQSWGCAVFEAMASGTPVIVSRTAGASEVLVDNRDAMIVEPRSPVPLAAAILALAHSAELRAALSAEGLKSVQELTWDRHSAQLLQRLKSARV